MTGIVTAVAGSGTHQLGKTPRGSVRLLAGLGVEGDAHVGATVQHRSRVALDAARPNLRQVHLLHAELHDALRAAGFDVAASRMGENVTTCGVELLALPTGARLRLGAEAVVEVTGCATRARSSTGCSRASWPRRSAATGREPSCAGPA